jgi:hypothetical protein
MLSNGFAHVRGNAVAYVALFFALSGGALAANTYIRSTDAIPPARISPAARTAIR